MAGLSYLLSLSIAQIVNRTHANTHTHIQNLTEHAGLRRGI